VFHTTYYTLKFVHLPLLTTDVKLVQSNKEYFSAIYEALSKLQAMPATVT